jgi:hypothetical protein
MAILAFGIVFFALPVLILMLKWLSSSDHAFPVVFALGFLAISFCVGYVMMHADLSPSAVWATYATKPVCITLAAIVGLWAFVRIAQVMPQGAFVPVAMILVPAGAVVAVALFAKTANLIVIGAAVALAMLLAGFIVLCRTLLRAHEVNAEVLLRSRYGEEPARIGRGNDGRTLIALPEPVKLLPKHNGKA